MNGWKDGMDGMYNVPKVCVCGRGAGGGGYGRRWHTYISYDYYNNNKLNTLCKLNCEKCAFGTFRIDAPIERLKFDR